MGLWLREKIRRKRQEIESMWQTFSEKMLRPGGDLEEDWT